jgi:hypothetical protein
VIHADLFSVVNSTSLVTSAIQNQYLVIQIASPNMKEVCAQRKLDFFILKIRSRFAVYLIKLQPVKALFYQSG